MSIKNESLESVVDVAGAQTGVSVADGAEFAPDASVYLESDEFTVEVDEGERASSPEDYAEIQRKFAEQEAELKRLQAEANNATAIKESFSGFGEQLTAQQRELAAWQKKQYELQQQALRGNQQASIPQMTKVELENFMADPTKTLDSFVTSKVLPAFQQMQTEINALKGQLGQQAVRTQYSDLYTKYGDEINTYARQLGGTPQAYEQATKMVQADHIDDIIAAKVAERMAETGGTTQPNQANEKIPANQASFSAATNGSAQGGGSSKAKVKLTQGQIDAIKADALRKGVSEKAYFEYLNNSGKLNRYK